MAQRFPTLCRLNYWSTAFICDLSALSEIPNGFYIEICEACASECEKHQDISHCQKCAEAGHRTAEEYRKVANILDVA